MNFHLRTTAAAAASHFPVHGCKGAALTDRHYLQIRKGPAVGTLFEVGIGNALEESCDLFPGLKAMDGRVSAHGDCGYVVKRGNAIAIKGFKGLCVLLEETSDLASECRLSHASSQ
jgi:hypothetical protein